VSLGQQSAQAGVAPLVLAEKGQVIATFNIYLSANDGLDAHLAGFVIEPYGPGKAIVVGDGQGGHSQGDSHLKQFIDGRSPVEEAVLGVDMEVNEAHRNTF
jgi:hypothetical protein